MRWKAIVEDNTTPLGKAFDLAIQFLIIVSLISFSIETLPNLSQSTSSLLQKIELVTVLIFTAEYLLRVLVAERRFKFIFSFYGAVDLLAILPFFLSTGIDLRSIRVFRLLRLFRAFKLLRYNQAIDRYRKAFSDIKEELILFSFVTMILLYLSAVGIYLFEGGVQPEAFSSVFTSFWWAITTLTTVGYGDVYPITTGGRIFTSFVLMIGLGIVAVPTGLIASALSKNRNGE